MFRFRIDGTPRCIFCQHFRTEYRKCMMIGGKPFIEYKTQAGVCALVRGSHGEDYPRSALFPPLKVSSCNYKPWVELP